MIHKSVHDVFLCSNEQLIKEYGDEGRVTMSGGQQIAERNEYIFTPFVFITAGPFCDAN